MKMKTYEGSYRISAYAIFSIAYGNRLAVFFYLQIRSDSHIVTSLWARRCLKSPSPRLFAQPFVRSKKTSKLRITGLCEGNPPVAGGFPS